MAQKHLFDPKAGLRLKSIVAKKADSEPSSMDEILLEPQPNHGNEDQSLHSSEDERSLLFESEKDVLVTNMCSQAGQDKPEPGMQEEKDDCDVPDTQVQDPHSEPKDGAAAVETASLIDEDEMMDF